MAAADRTNAWLVLPAQRRLTRLLKNPAAILFLQRLSNSSLAIRFECPECGKTLSVQDQLAGKKVKCPCGAVVVANPSGPTAPVATPTATPKRPSPAAVPTKPAPTGRPAVPVSDLRDLFDELTPTDLETRAQRTEAAAGEPAKVDPLAAYRPVAKGGGRGKSSGPAVDRPLGLKILAGLAVLGIVGSLAGAAVAFASPDTLQRGPQPLDPNVIKLTGGLLIGSAVTGLVLVSALLTPQPWAWWFVTLFYSASVWVRLINSVFEAQQGNAALAAGKAVGGVLVGALVLGYLYRQETRDFYSIKVPVWLGPAVSIPAGLAIGFGLILGIGAAVLAIQG